MLNRIHNFLKTNVGAYIYGAPKRQVFADGDQGAMNRAPTGIWIFLTFIFASFVIFTFFRNHLNYFSITSWQNLFSAVPIFTTTFLASFALLLLSRPKISAIKIILFLFFATFLTFCAFGLIQNLFTEVSVLETIFRIFGTLFVFFFSATIFTIFLTGIGDGISSSFSKTKISILEKFALGLAVFSCALWPIARFGFFDIGILTLVFLVFWGAFFRNFISVARTFITKKIEITKLETGLISIFFVVTSFNFLHHFLPFTLGWDTATEYFLTIKNLVATGVLPNDILPAATETVLASGSVFLGLSFASFLLIFLGSFLPVFIIFLSKKIGASQFKSTLFALVFLLLPAVQFQLSKDLKMDLIFLEIILSALLLWQRKSFNLSVFLFGFAVVQKLTAVFFWPVLIILIATKKINLRSRISLTLLLFLPIFIFGIVNFASLSFPSVSNSTEVRNVFLRAKISGSLISFAEFPPQTSTGFIEEVGRYSEFSKSFFIKISSLLTSKEIPSEQKQFVDLGFCFFVFLPFLFFAIFQQRQAINRSDFENLLLATAFFVFWILLGYGVPWYGFPALVIFGIYSLKFIRPAKFIIIVLTLSIITGIASRFQNFSINPAIASVSWATFPNTENAKRLEKEFFSSEISIAEIVNQNLNSKIWRVGTLSEYWISEPENRVFNDPQLDYFSIIFSEENPQIPLEFWRKNNFKFIILDRGTTSIEQDENGSLHQKFRIFEKFARANLEILQMGERAILFRID